MIRIVPRKSTFFFFAVPSSSAASICGSSGKNRNERCIIHKTVHMIAMTRGSSIQNFPTKIPENAETHVNISH